MRVEKALMVASWARSAKTSMVASVLGIVENDRTLMVASWFRIGKALHG